KQLAGFRLKVHAERRDRRESERLVVLWLQFERGLEFLERLPEFLRPVLQLALLDQLFCRERGLCRGGSRRLRPRRLAGGLCLRSVGERRQPQQCQGNATESDREIVDSLHNSTSLEPVRFTECGKRCEPCDSLVSRSDAMNCCRSSKSSGALPAGNASPCPTGSRPECLCLR